MPYIKQEFRGNLDVNGHKPENVGDLNYLITRLCTKYVLDKGERYQSINDVVGALECAKLEFYRRLAAPYEDTKIAENGDVY